MTASTVTPGSITNVSAISGGNISNDGGSAVTARGVCWATSHNPDLSATHTSDGTGTGTFSSSLTGLTAGTTYYVRAYATNGKETAYGNEASFTATNIKTADMYVVGLESNGTHKGRTSGKMASVQDFRPAHPLVLMMPCRYLFPIMYMLPVGAAMASLQLHLYGRMERQHS